MSRYDDMSEAEFQECLRRKGQAKHDLEQMRIAKLQCPWFVLFFVIWAIYEACTP